MKMLQHQKIVCYIKHTPNNPVRLLKTGCNTVIEKLLSFKEVACDLLTNNTETRIRDTSHLLDIIDELFAEIIPDNIILVSFDNTSMYPSIDNSRVAEYYYCQERLRDKDK